MKIVDTFTATIYCGSREAYTNVVCDYGPVYDFCQDYCDKVGLCVSFSQTSFIYKNGNEPGFVIGLINYPRFPSSKVDIVNHAHALVEGLFKLTKQERISVVFPEETIMFEKGDFNEKNSETCSV